MKSFASQQQEFYDHGFKTIAPDFVAESIRKFVFENILNLLGRQKGDSFQPQDILEIGCGEGHLLRRMKDHFPRANIEGVDLSEKCVHEAQKQGFRVFTYNVEDIGELRKSYDLIYGSAILHHLEDLPRTIKGLRSLIRPGGCLVIGSEPTYYNVAYIILHILRGTWKIEKGLLRFSPSFLYNLFLEAQLNNITIVRNGNAFFYAIPALGRLYHKFKLNKICFWDDLYLYAEP